MESSSDNRSSANSHFIAAAKARINIFEKFQRANFEGFQLPNFIDKIIIGVGMKAATDSGSVDAPDLLLRGGEVLSRNLRYST